MLSFGVYLSLTFVRLSLRACVSWLLVSSSTVSSCVSCFLGFSLLHVLFAFIDPVSDRRIIYNDFRSNPYLHFDAGLVPRALGVQLGEFYCFVCSLHFLFVMLPSCIILLLLLITLSY